MLGIIIGVLSVVTAVSIGEGVKQQLTGQINKFGEDLITVQPGKTVTRDASGQITNVNLFSSFGTTSLTEADLEVVRNSGGVRLAVPLSPINGIAEYEGRQFSQGIILGTTEAAPEALNQPVQYGAFFSEKDANQNGVVIGTRVAQELFQENVPIAKTLRIRDQTFIVRGVFEEFENSPLTPTLDYNSAIFMPYSVGKELTNNQALIREILAKPTNVAETEAVAGSIRTALLSAHAGQEDFTVLRQEENLAVAGNILDLVTTVIAGIAAISLIVGGIGIMNIMFVSVTERTQEIGIRKAIGATNNQILSQFLIEALMLSLIGGIIGVLMSGLANYLLRIFTNLTPVITLPVVGVSIVVAVVVGVIFGVAPALRAARKNPIDALRAV